ncbi:hypothetical protein HYZ64_02750 [Candidatus Berkelbacteria bacterium]|nr:hypothetical protein [Candidatus Berkelbacteria bacterium]
MSVQGKFCTLIGRFDQNAPKEMRLMQTQIIQRQSLEELCQMIAQLLVKPNSAPEIRWTVSDGGQETTMRVQGMGAARIPIPVRIPRDNTDVLVDTVLVWGIQTPDDIQDAGWEQFYVRLSDNAKILGKYDEVIVPMSLDLTNLLAHLTQPVQGSVVLGKRV